MRIPLDSQCYHFYPQSFAVKGGYVEIVETLKMVVSKHCRTYHFDQNWPCRNSNGRQSRQRQMGNDCRLCPTDWEHAQYAANSAIANALFAQNRQSELLDYALKMQIIF